MFVNPAATRPQNIVLFDSAKYTDIRSLTLLNRNAFTGPPYIRWVRTFEIVIGKDGKIKQIDGAIFIEVTW